MNKLPTMVSGYAYKASSKFARNRETVIVGESELSKAVFQTFETIDGIGYCRFRIGRTYYWQLSISCGTSSVTMFDDRNVDDGRIYADKSELLYNPPKWMKVGLQQTATGYGGKLNTGLEIYFNGKFRRVYCMCYSNSGTCYFYCNGKRIIVS